MMRSTLAGGYPTPRRSMQKSVLPPGPSGGSSKMASHLGNVPSGPPRPSWARFGGQPPGDQLPSGRGTPRLPCDECPGRLSAFPVPAVPPIVQSPRKRRPVPSRAAAWRGGGRPSLHRGKQPGLRPLRIRRMAPVRFAPSSHHGQALRATRDRGFPDPSVAAWHQRGEHVTHAPAALALHLR